MRSSRGEWIAPGRYMPGACVSFEAVPLEVACLEHPGCHGRRGRDDLRRWKFLAPLHPHESDETVLRLSVIAEALSGELVTLSVIDGTSSAYETNRRDPLARDVILHGDPASRIRSYSSFLRPDLILMPLHRRRFRIRFWRRSVLENILLRTDHAVMVVPDSSEWDPSQRIRNVLCVVQLDGTDDLLTDRAAAIASRLNAETTLLHVLPEINEGTLASGVERCDAPLSLTVASERIAKLRVRGGPHQVEIRTGDIHRNIATVARDLHADLIVTQSDVCRSTCPAIYSLQRYAACPILSLARSPASYPPAQS